MYNILHIKKLICKLLTCWIFSPNLRKNARNFLFYFSFNDYLRFKKQDFYIVSLGNNCLPRVIATAIKLKPRKIYGEKTMPFDLKVTPDLNRTIKLINNNFDDFFDDIKISKDLFPHDYKLSETKFKKRYTQRIKNFLDVINSSKQIYFIYSDFDNLIDRKSLINLFNILKLKRNGKPFKIIVLTARPIKNINNPDIKIIVKNFKINDANWVESFINDYKNINNCYTEFCNSIEKEIFEVIS